MVTAFSASLALMTTASPTLSREVPPELPVIQDQALDAAIDVVGFAAVLALGRED